MVFKSYAVLKSISYQEMSRNVRKRTIGHVRAAKIQISLCNQTVLSQSSIGAFWTDKETACIHANTEDSNQTARMRRLIWFFDGHTSQKVRFLTLRLELFEDVAKCSKITRTSYRQALSFKRIDKTHLASLLTLLAPNFRRHLSSAFFYFNKLSFGKTFICKVKRLNVKQRRSR